ncbi:MAG: YggS family pyridoxal phosphate-dependent enzyme [Gammaproteobacteria bacterium]|nr:YggS family pyridoxal phosphate-dependent enzyme [Gammaproteobacteria bacterium]
MTEVTDNIHTTQEQIAELEQQSGRPRGSVTLIAVSKRQPVSKIREAASAGMRDFGENYLQEAVEKQQQLEGLYDLIWHFIGPIQSNKTRGISENFDWVHSVDRSKIVRRLSEQRPLHLKPLNVCIQINLSEEETKSGATSTQAAELCALTDSLENIRLRGLMAIPAPTDNREAQRDNFIALSRLFDTLKSKHPSMDTLSMGMSNDYGPAILQGSTMIRLGTALFGPRPS